MFLFIIHFSPETTDKGNTDFLSEHQVRNLVQKPDLLRVTEKVEDPLCIAFWIAESSLESTALGVNDEIRLQTCGDCPLIGRPSLITKRMVYDSTSSCKHLCDDKSKEELAESILLK
jgi:hypothetical protein